MSLKKDTISMKCLHMDNIISQKKKKNITNIDTVSHKYWTLILIKKILQISNIIKVYTNIVSLKFLKLKNFINKYHFS